MRFEEGTFYKCIGWDYRDLHSGDVNFKPMIGHAARMDDHYVHCEDAMARLRQFSVCSPQVIHASPWPIQAAYYGANALRFKASTDLRPGLSALRMLECWGIPVARGYTGVPKAGFRYLDLVREIPHDEIRYLLSSAKVFNYTSLRGSRYPRRITPGQLDRIMGQYFPRTLRERVPGRHLIPTPAH